MVFFRHPESVVDPRPVAELTVRSATAGPSARGSLIETRPAGAPNTLIRFKVSYGLREYPAIVDDFIPIALRA